VLINRGGYFQAGLIIRKGSFEEIKAQGLEAFQNSVRQIAPYLGDRPSEIKSFDEVKLLTVQLNRLRQWYRPGLLCIGDAAHAMSPAGGVGINLAIQDAVATANLLADALREKRVTTQLLAKIQQRRQFPTEVTQALQANAHKLFEKVFQNPGPAHAPWQLKVAVQIPGVQRALARVVGIGVRPEHIQKAARRPKCATTKLVKIAVGVGVIAASVAFALRAAKKYSRCQARLSWREA